MYDGLTESSDFDMSGATPSHPSLSTATSEVPSHATQSVTNQTMPVAGEAHPAHLATSAAEAPHLTSPVLPQTLQASDLPTTLPLQQLRLPILLRLFYPKLCKRLIFLPLHLPSVRPVIFLMIDLPLNPPLYLTLTMFSPLCLHSGIFTVIAVTPCNFAKFSEMA